MRAIALAVVLGGVHILAQSEPEATLKPVLDKMAAYISGYGEKASLIVAVEKYTQSVLLEGAPSPAQPRRIVAEFAIIRASDNSGWVGFRDVVEVDGNPLRERRDRLMSLFTSSSGDASEATRIANESARYNVGPIIRNFNVPTTTLFFFLPEHLARFAFVKKGEARVEGVRTWEITFKETRSPTFVMRRSGQDVPIDGVLWVNPDDGTVVKTRMRMRNFADGTTSPEQTGPVQRPEMNPNVPQGGRPAAVFEMDIGRIDTEAEIEVVYRKHQETRLWLPATMEEQYAGPILITRTHLVGRARTRAAYSDFKQFGTSIKLLPPPQ